MSTSHTLDDGYPTWIPAPGGHILCRVHAQVFDRLDACAECSADPVMPVDIEQPAYWRSCGVGLLRCDHHGTFAVGRACRLCLIADGLWSWPTTVAVGCEIGADEPR